MPAETNRRRHDRCRTHGACQRRRLYDVSGVGELWRESGIDRVNKAVGVVLQAPDLRERIIADGFTPAYSKPGEYCERLEKDVARWKDVVKKANIKINVIG